MKYEPVQFGFSTSDAENVSIHFEDGDLLLSFRDWREKEQQFCFPGTLAFRWEENHNIAEIRDDESYVVKESDWIESQDLLRGEKIAAISHYKLCFNACGVLDVICESVAG